ncbi:hypothetical protein Poli38472_005291 [Pythium oligandrum]|uniref:histidine kinase n=1 Tax=Pythium oligandrum TaxID=41045 RepID=A0A8K1CGP5_PYTOL|nr:hypothetical protein Poli38472_005291 [Pythium oligandrum]|eukprot:TMW62673.1 hypothetical protein Poli38472_005291 [Pythium oligandrum]
MTRRRGVRRGSSSASVVADAAASPTDADTQSSDAQPLPGFLRIFEDAIVPTFAVDPHGVVTLWNKTLTRLTSRNAKAVVGSALDEIIIRESERDQFKKYMTVAVDEKRTTDKIVVPMLTLGGRTLQIETKLTPLIEEDGTVSGVYCIGTDVTEQYVESNLYENVILQANAPIIELDRDANITVWNAKTASLTGFASADVIGTPLAPIVEEHFRTELTTHFNQTLSMAVPGGDIELPLITSTGSRVEIALCLTPKFNMSGAVIGVVAIGQDVTERNAKEMEYKRFIDTANAPILGADLDGRIVIFNKKAVETSEYTPEEVMGVNLIENLIAEEYRDAVADVFQKAYKGVETANVEFPFITKSGRRVEILLNATPRYNHLGDLCGVIGIGQDITDRIIQEQEYSRLIDTANAPIFGVDREFNVIIWNKKAAGTTEYTNEDTMGQDLLKFISAEYRDAVQDVLSKALDGIETANFEFPLISKSGRRVEILLNATPKYDHFGNISGVVGIGQDITDRIAQEQEYTRLIDTANAPIFGVDEDGRVNIWNRKAAQITEYSVFDVLGANLVENFIPQEYKQEVGAVLRKAIEGVETANFEFPLITRTGRRVEILLNATPRYDNKGTIIGVVGIGQDITVRLAQEQEYTRLIDTANAPIFGVDMKGQVNIWNKKAAEITQFSIEEVMGKDLVNRFVSEENRAAVSFALRKALQGAQTANFDFPLITKTGRRVEILLNATPRYNELGEIVGVVGIGQDITDRIAQEQEYTRLIDTANAPIFGVDEEGRVNIWNKKAAEITQYTPEDVMGENLVEKFITEDYREAVGFVLSKALDGTETANFEFPLITKTGRRVEILLNATPRFNEHRRVMGMVGIGQDITDRIAQEQEYSRLIDKANAPIFGVDVNGCLNIWNHKAAEITQYTTDEVIGENLVQKFISEDFQQAVADVLSKALKHDESANFELPLTTKTGRDVIFLLNATARFDQHGQIVGVVGIGQDITERKAQEQEYSRLIDTANAPIFGVDVEGRVNIWNKKAAEITQYTTSDVMGENLVEKFITKDYREAVGYVLSKALAGTETANFEFPLITKTDRRVEILLNATPRFNEHGEVMGMVGIGQDITDRIAQEQEYSRLIDKANAPIFGVDVNGCLNIWNKKAQEITQYQTDEVLGENLVLKFISEDFQEAVADVLSKALKGDESANFELPLTTKTGRNVIFLLNATARFDQHGQIVGVVGIGQDITERKAQEQEYSRLIDTANAPIFGVDVEGRVNIWNKKAAEITQYTTSDVMGENLVEKFITEDYREAVAQVLSMAIEGSETANFEFPLITKTGRRVEILLNATPRYNELGKVMGMVGIGQDITDRIAQEQEYTRLIDTANAPIFGVDEEGRVNIWNKKAAEITQYSQTDVMGENLVEKFITEDYREAVGYVLSKALHGVETANFEFPLMTKTGRRVEILLNATPRYNELGKVKGMVGIGQDITDRIAQEQEYSRLIDTANAPIFGVDVDGLVNIWNEKAAEITQYTTEDVMGENLVEKFITEDYREAVGYVLSKALDGTETANFEFPLITKTGRRVEILLNATPRFNEHGRVMGMVGIGQDITDRIAQEQEYSRLIDTANAPIFGVDANMVVNIWNRKAAEITQYTTEEVVGANPVFKFVSENSQEGVADVLTRALQGDETANFELQLRTKTGRDVIFLLNATARFDQHGQIVGVVGIGQDITERKAQEQEYSRLIDTANAPIFGVDVEGRVNIWNKKAAEITQYTTSDVMGENLVEKFITEDYREAVAQVLSMAIEGSETANFEFPLITKTGRRVEILLNATCRYNEHGEVMGMVGIGQDITDRIAQEQEYSRLIDTANAPIFGVDVEGRVNIWNEKAVEITQYTTSDVMGENLVEKFITKDYREAVGYVLSKALAGTETANFEFPLITKTDRRVEILLNATPRFNEHGEVMGMVGIGQDITDRIAQEQEYSRLIDKANAPIFGVDVNGCLNIWNKKAQEITQYQTDEVLGENLVLKFISEDFQEAVADVLSKALNGDESANFELPLTTKTGRDVIFLLNATARFDQHGQIVGVVGIGQDITERIAQEEEYTRLIDTANAPIFGVDEEGRVNIWNKKAAEITQYTQSDVMGENLVEKFITEDYREAVAQVLSKALNGFETANFEFPLMTKTGRRVEILLNATPRFNEHGKVKGMVGIGQDITDRIAQEQEYSRLIDTANAPIFGVDGNMCVNIWNKKAAEITQYTPSDVMGENLVEKFITKDYREAVGYVLSKALDGTETANFEFPLITKTDRRVEILLNATPRFNEHGEVIGVVGIGQDITDRIAQEQEYSRLIDKANAPIFGVDVNGCLNIWNRKAAEITQYTTDDVIGENLVLKFISEDFQQAVADVLSKALKGDESANFELPLTTKTGRDVIFLLNATARFDQHGQIVGVVGIGQDITERKAQEQEYSRLIDTANAPIFGVDVEGRVNIWNKKAAEITQYTTSDVMGENLVEKFITEDYREAVAQVLSMAIEGSETANFEFPLITKTGRRVEILLNATCRYNEHGEVMGMVGIGQDITDRIAQEQEYSRLIDTANAPIFGVDVEGRVNIWNEKAVEITQYTTSDVMGENLVEKFITKDYREAVGYVLSKALAGTETANFEFPLITKTDRRVEILLNATPRFNEHGEVMGMVGIGQDITDRIAQEQEYSRLIDKANAPIFGVDVNGCLNIWNKKAQEITQYQTDEVLGENLVLKFISEDFQQAVADVLSKALKGDESANFELPLTTKTGRNVIFLLNATARFDQHGQIVGVVGIGQDITERKAQEQEYSRLIDTANAPIFGVDVEGRVNIWNKKAAEITQYTTSDVMGENLVEKFITEDYREAVAQVLSKALNGSETANFEFPLMTKTGRRVEILLNATPRFNEHGEVMGMVGIGQDITDRIAQEQEYTRLIDTANAPIFGVDANMCVNIWNKKAAQITNYSINEVMGENLVETFISPEYRPIVADVLAKALQGIQTANFEFPLITRPGTRIEILLNATPRMDSNGDIVGVVGIGQDITDRIAQEHEYFRLIDTANAPIFGVDTNGCINEWNQKIEEITGYHKSTVLGLSLVNTFIIPESRQQVRQLLNQALIGIDVGEMELPMTTKKGVFLLLLVNASSKKDMHGNIRGVIGVGQDYTARKQMEAAKVNFLASFSHELRTPLNSVLGMMELLKEQKLDTVSERYVHMAYVSGSLLLNLINDILDLSKIEAGHMEISAAPFHMKDLLDYSIDIFDFKARERGLVLEKRCDPQVPSIVIGDVVRLRQVLLNLLSNALKFTTKGSITVTCSVEPSPDLPSGFKKLRFEVIDTGVGMDAEEKSRLFSLFTKLERTRQNNPTGSGLGLAICKQFVELMDGQIDVDSELDVGSNFFFTVVVRLLDDEEVRKGSIFGSDEFIQPTALLMSNVEANAVSSNDSNGASATVNGPIVVVPAKARILVVEDNEFNWEVVKCFLQEDDHLLQWEKNGRDAVNAYIQHHNDFDLVFMDCEMPILNGYAATTMIRQFENEKNLDRIPVLGLTAYAMNEDRLKCLEAGMDEIMVKPISKIHLRKAIRQWMKIRYLGAQKSGGGIDDTLVIPAGSKMSSHADLLRDRSVTRLRGSSPHHFAKGVTTSRPARPAIENLDGSKPAATPPKSTRLAPASQHMQQLDLAWAISNLELDDPMAIARNGGRAFRTAAPSTSIFSLNVPMPTPNQRPSSGSQISTTNNDKTSTTLPTGKSSPLYQPDLGDHINIKRASYPKTPIIWSEDEIKLTSASLTGASFPPPQDFFSRRSDNDDAERKLNIEALRVLTGQLPGSSPSHSTLTSDKQRGAGDAENGSTSSMSPFEVHIPEGDPVNYALGVDQCGGSEELFQNLLEKFAMGCEAAMGRIESAYMRRDIVLMKRESHSLKGSSAYVAAMRVSKSAFRVQIACERILDHQTTSSGASDDRELDFSDVEPALVKTLEDTFTYLKKEHRLLRGYLRRNFGFLTATSTVAKPIRDDDHRHHHNSGNNSACCLM